MPQLFKTTWMVDYGKGGFSFSHWINSDAGYSGVGKLAEKVAQNYLNMCGDDVEINYVRVSDEKIKGDSFIVQKNFSNRPAGGGTTKTAGAAYFPAVGGNPDYWNTCALVRLGASASMYGRQYIRGIPDGVVLPPDREIRDAKWAGALGQFIKGLCADGWGMYCIPRGPDLRQEINNIAAAGGITTVTTKGVHGINAGSKVRISGFISSDNSVVNGIYKAIAGTGDHTVALDPRGNNPIVNGRVLNWGFIWSLDKQFAAYTVDNCTFIRVSSRRAGRPFDVLVGRRKRKK